MEPFGSGQDGAPVWQRLQFPPERQATDPCKGQWIAGKPVTEVELVFGEEWAIGRGVETVEGQGTMGERETGVEPGTEE